MYTVVINHEITASCEYHLHYSFGAWTFFSFSEMLPRVSYCVLVLCKHIIMSCSEMAFGLFVCLFVLYLGAFNFERTNIFNYRGNNGMYISLSFHWKCETPERHEIGSFLGKKVLFLIRKFALPASLYKSLNVN